MKAGIFFIKKNTSKKPSKCFKKTILLTCILKHLDKLKYLKYSDFPDKSQGQFS